MDEKELSRQYTDENYLSKEELKAALKTSLIDGYWDDLTHYREKFVTKLPFKTVSNHPFFLTLTPAIQNKLDVFDSLSQKFGTVITNLKEDKSYETSLKNVRFAAIEGIPLMKKDAVSPLSLKAMVNGLFRGEDEKETRVNSYLKTIDYYFLAPLSIPDDSFLGEAYGLLLGGELTSFYREKDFDSLAQKARYSIDSPFPYAPSDQVEGMMDSFLSFVADPSYKPLIKALASLYFFDYVKPFNEFNDELAVLFASANLSSKVGNSAFYLPLALGLKKEGRYEPTLFNLVQMSGDLTYYVLYALDLISSKLNAVLDTIEKEKLKVYEEEAKLLSLEEEKAAKAQGLIEEKKKEETPKEVSVPPVNESPVPVIEKKKEEAPVASLPKVEGEVSISLSKKDIGLSDKEIKEYTRYLLESNPSLSKHQAAFLAGHCTIGRYYTIQQFKSFAHCAYETARTSMDKLAGQAYYKKMQIKNKYVYTPVQQGDKK